MIYDLAEADRYRGPESAWGPSWSKDGRWLAFIVGPPFASAAVDVDIWKIRSDGSGAVSLTPDSDANDALPDFSPDGRRLVFRSRRDGNAEIYLMNADGGDVQRLTRHEATDTMPAFSSGGDRVAFTSLRDGNFELYTIAFDEDGRPGPPERLTTSPGHDMHPRFSPDDEWVLFTSQRGEFNDELPLLRVDFQPQPYGELHAIRLSDRTVVRLTHNKWEGRPYRLGQGRAGPRLTLRPVAAGLPARRRATWAGRVRQAARPLLRSSIPRRSAVRAGADDERMGEAGDMGAGRGNVRRRRVGGIRAARAATRCPRRRPTVPRRVRIMSKEACVEVGGSRWWGRSLAAAARLAAVGLLVAGGLTAGPGAAVAAAQAPGADGAFTADQAASGLVGLRRPVQRVPRHRPRGLDRAAAGGRGVPQHLGRADDRRAVRVPARHDAPGAGRHAQRPVLRGPRGVPDRVERRPAGRAYPDGRCGGDDRRCGGHLRARRAAQAGELPRRRSTRFVNREVPHELTPVTDALLADPPAGDWLSWRRTRTATATAPWTR